MKEWPLNEKTKGVHFKGGALGSLREPYCAPKLAPATSVICKFRTHNLMYMPKTYLNEEILERIVSRYDWPYPYSLEEDLPDGILMKFPYCTLYFSEGFESDMDLDLIWKNNGSEFCENLIDVFTMIIPNFETQPDSHNHLNLINDTSPSSSEPKVENGIKDICVLVLHYLQPALNGDFSWYKG